MTHPSHTHILAFNPQLDMRKPRTLRPGVSVVETDGIEPPYLSRPKAI